MCLKIAALEEENQSLTSEINDCSNYWNVQVLTQANEKYIGDARLQKKFTVDFLTKKQKVNEGDVPQYYVENSHPAIFVLEVFDLVQYEWKQRK